MEAEEEEVRGVSGTIEEVEELLLSEEEMNALVDNENEEDLLPHERLILREKNKKNSMSPGTWREGKAPAENVMMEEKDKKLLQIKVNLRNVTNKKCKSETERSAIDTKTGWASEQEEEKYLREEWPFHEKHFFVLSNVGRPIYSRYGDEQKLCSFMPILSTIANLVQHSGDTLRTIVSGDHQFVFLFKGPLFLVAISSTYEPAHHLLRQLEYLHAQILAAMTANVNKIYESRPHFDMRSLLGNSTAFLDNIIDLMDSNPSYIASMILNAVSCLRIEPGMRANIGSILHQNRTEETVYSLLVARKQLVSIVRLRRHTLHSADFHLILNFLSSSSSIHSDASSSSTVPVCLPRFNDKGYLHVYVSFLAPEISLLLIATKPGNFDKEKDIIEKELKAIKALDAITVALAKSTDDYYNGKVIDGGPIPPSPDTLGYQRSMKPGSMGDIASNGGSQDSPTSAFGRMTSSLLSTVNASGSLLSSAQLRSDADDYNNSDNNTNLKKNSYLSNLTALAARAQTIHFPQNSTNSNNNSKALTPRLPTSVFPSLIQRRTMRRLLLHFIYKHKPTSQYTCPLKLEAPYTTLAEQKRLFRVYQHVHSVMNGGVWVANNTDGSTTQGKAKKAAKRMRKSHKILFQAGERENVLGWVTPSFELYAIFGPMVTKTTCIYACNQLLAWIKAEELSLFIMNSPVW